MYYGKQENVPKDEMAREISKLRTQITKLTKSGHIILAGDFSAKININRENVTQTASRNGSLLEEILDDLQLSAVSTKSNTGTWTRVPWNKKRTQLNNRLHNHQKGDEQLAIENIVDETEAQLKGANKSDFNTLCLTLRIKHTEENTKMSRWKNKNKNEDEWTDSNKEIQRIEIKGIKDYSHIEEKIK